MTTAFLDIDDGNISGLARRLEFGIGQLSDLRPVFRRLIPEWAQTRRRMYDTQGSSIGAQWPNYTRAERQYAAVKGKIHGRWVGRGDLLRWKIGQERLRPSLINPGDENFVPRETDLQPLRASYGTRVPYASNHNRGQGRAPKWAGSYQIPRRTIVNFSPDFAVAVNAHVAAYATEVASSIAIKTADVNARPLAGRPAP